MDTQGLPPHDTAEQTDHCALENTQENAQDVFASEQPEVSGQAMSLHAEAQPPRILVVEDDVPLARLLGGLLKLENFKTRLAHDGEDALNALAEEHYDLLLLDLNLPKIDGLTLLARLRQEQPSLAVLVLTGRNRTEDRVLSLNQGADDCLIKPFSLVELLARVRALLRRGTTSGSDPAPKVQPGLMINREEYRVERDGRRIELTRREFALLDFLMQHAPRPVSRATLMEQVWHIPYDPNTNVVDVYMKYLRDKIDGNEEEKLIRTVRGVGYALACA